MDQSKRYADLSLKEEIVCKTKPAAHYTAGVLQISENTIQQSEIRSRPDKFRHGQEHS